MRLLACVLLALVALPADALDRRDRSRRDTPVLEVLPGGTGAGVSTADYPAAGFVQTTMGVPLTNARVSIRTCCTVDETSCHTIPVGGSCVRGAALDVSGDSVQLLARSSEFDDAAWTKSGSPTVVSNDAVAPDGTTTADRITVGGLGVNSIAQGGFGAAGNPVAPSIWIKRVSTSGTLRVVNSGSSANGNWNVDLSAIGDGWVRIQSANQTGVTQTAAWTFTGAGVGGIALAASSGTVEFHAWGAQVNPGSTAQPYCPSGATAPVTCLKDVVTVATTDDWPVASGEISLSYIPLYATGVVRELVDLRPDIDDGYSLFVSSGDRLSFIGRDGGVGTAAQSEVLTWTPGQRYRIRVRWGDGEVSAWRDGVSVINAAAITTPSTIAATACIGCAFNGTLQAGGTVSDLEVRR